MCILFSPPKTCYELNKAHTYTHSPPKLLFSTHTHRFHFILQPNPIHFSIFLQFFPSATSATPYYNPLYLHIKLGKASACFIVKCALAHVTAYVISRVNPHKAHVRPVREQHQEGRKGRRRRCS